MNNKKTTTMKNFNTKRFARVMGWDFCANYRSYIRITLLMSLGFTFVFVMNFLSIRSMLQSATFSAFDMPYVYTFNIAGLSFMFGYFFIMAYSTNIFKHYRSKQQRIGLLMLPASNLEKFLTRLLSVSLSGILIFVAAFLIADVAQFIISYAFSPSIHIFLTSKVLMYLGELMRMRSLHASADDMITLYFWLIWVTGFLSVHSTFILGGTFFRRNAFLCTICVYVALIIALITLILCSFGTIDNWLNDNMHDFTQSMASATIYVASAVNVVMAAVCYWLSYKVFCRMQVINNKWTNW